MQVKIRSYQKKDRESIRKISVSSSILAEYSGKLFDHDLIADFLTSYYTDYDPSSSFVAEKDQQVIGYLLGSMDAKKMQDTFKKYIFPKTMKDILKKGHFLKVNNLLFFKNMLYSYFKGEFKFPDFTQRYPATLHVNVTAASRGLNVGTLLVNNFTDFIKENRSEGVHFGVLSHRAKHFFEKLDFEVLFTGKYSFLTYLNGEIMPHYIMGKSYLS